MSSKGTRIRPPLWMLIAIPVLIVIAIVANPIIQSQPKDFLTSNVLLTGIPFIAVFIAILFAFICLIFVAAGYFHNNIDERPFRVVEYIVMAGIILGVIGMFQPFWQFGYQYGFLLLLFSTLAFTLWSHIAPKIKARSSDVTSPSGEQH